MPDLHHRAGQQVAGIAALLHPEGAVGVVVKGDLSHLPVLHVDILHIRGADQVIRGRFPFNDRIISTEGQVEEHLAGAVGGEGAHAGAVGVDDLEQGPAEPLFAPRLLFDDAQPGVRGVLRFIAVIALGRQTDGGGGVGVADVVLELPVLALLRADRVIDGVLVHIAGEGQLDAAALALHAAGRVQHLYLPGIAVPGAAGGDGGNVIVVRIHQPGTLRHLVGVGEGHIDIVIADPGIAFDGEYLLEILRPVDGDGIGCVLIHRAGQPGGLGAAPRGAADIDVLGGSQDRLRPLQLHARQVGIDLEVVNVPIGEQIAPEGHLGGVVGVIFVLQLELTKPSGGVAVSHDAHDLGVTGLLLGQILDALAGGHRLRDALGVGIDAVSRDLFHLPGAGNIIIIGIDLLPDPPVDGQIGHCRAAVEDVHLTERLLLGAGGGGEAGAEAQERHEAEEQG